MNGSEVFVVTVLNLIAFVFAGIVPFYNKRLFTLVPYPITVTCCDMAMGVVPAFFIAWISVGRPRSWSWLVPSRRVFKRAVISAFTFGTMVGLNSLGIFISDIDFALLFRLSGVVWQGGLAWLVLNERLSKWSISAAAVVILGMFLIAAKFQWGDSRVPSTKEIAIQMAGVIAQACSAVSLKSVLNVIKEEGNRIPTMTVAVWRYTGSVIVLIFFSRILESAAWERDVHIFTPQAVLMMIGAVALSNMFNGVAITLMKLMSVMSGAVCNQLRFVPPLIMSRAMNGGWTLVQGAGAIMIFGGGMAFAVSQARAKETLRPNDASKDSYSVVGLDVEDDYSTGIEVGEEDEPSESN